MKPTQKGQTLLIAHLCLLFASCSVVQKTARNELSDGFYVKHSNTEAKKVYVDVVEDNIRIHPMLQDKLSGIDTNSACDIYFPELTTSQKISFSLSKTSFDVDFLTIPLKFRLSQQGVPPQLNSNLNGALYMGIRSDVYNINYRNNPLGKATRNTNHFGYSLGVFTGFGNTFMSPTNTNNAIQIEYDGVVWSRGLAAIIGVNNFTVGLGVGLDNLLDKNISSWIYEKKPWYGLAFGLNLN